MFFPVVEMDKSNGLLLGDFMFFGFGWAPAIRRGSCPRANAMIHFVIVVLHGSPANQ